MYTLYKTSDFLCLDKSARRTVNALQRTDLRWTPIFNLQQSVLKSVRLWLWTVCYIGVASGSPPRSPFLVASTRCNRKNSVVGATLTLEQATGGGKGVIKRLARLWAYDDTRRHASCPTEVKAKRLPLFVYLFI